jgi:hypothetical protein
MQRRSKPLNPPLVRLSTPLSVIANERQRMAEDLAWLVLDWLRRHPQATPWHHTKLQGPGRLSSPVVSPPSQP